MEENELLERIDIKIAELKQELLARWDENLYNWHYDVIVRLNQLYQLRSNLAGVWATKVESTVDTKKIAQDITRKLSQANQTRPL